jgi:hypothetical protein
VVIQRTLLFAGEPLVVAGALYAERTVVGVVAVAEGQIQGAGVVKWLKPGFEQGPLCGVADERDRGAGSAVLETIEFARRTIPLSSPVAAENLRVLQLGDFTSASMGASSAASDATGFERDPDSIGARRANLGSCPFGDPCANAGRHFVPIGVGDLP